MVSSAKEVDEDVQLASDYPPNLDHQHNSTTGGDTTVHLEKTAHIVLDDEDEDEDEDEDADADDPEEAPAAAPPKPIAPAEEELVSPGGASPRRN